MVDDDERRALIDAEHLRLLGLGYYVSAAMTAFFSLFGLLYMGMGFMFRAIARNAPAGPDAPPEAMGLMFALFGGVIFLLTATVAALKVYVARCLERRRQRILCLVSGAIGCLEAPYGTALGLSTFLVLGRPEVRSQFDR
jgi:hypothetical protein